MGQRKLQNQSDGSANNERARLAFRRRVHRGRDGSHRKYSNRDERHGHGRCALEVHRRSDDGRLARAGRLPGSSILEVRTGGAKLRIRNAALTTNTTDSTVNWDVAVASFHNDHVGEARGISATLATRSAIGDRRCDSTTRKLAKAEVDVVGGDTGLIIDTPLYALLEEAAPYIKKVGEEGLFCAFKCSRFVVRVLGIDVLGEAGIHAHLVDDDVGRGGVVIFKRQHCGGAPTTPSRLF